MCIRVLPTVHSALRGQDNTERFDPVTDWFPSTGIDILTFQLILANASGSFGVRPGIEWASVRTDNPSGTISTAGSQRTSDGAYVNKITPSVGTAGGMFYMRLGLLYETTTGSSESYGEVKLIPTLHECGRQLGHFEFQLNPGGADDTGVMWIPLGEWFPLAGIKKAKAAFIVEGCTTSTVRYILGCRTAVDPAEPNDWVEMEGGTYTNPGTANSGRNTGEESFPAGADVADNIYGQLGLGIHLSTGAASVARALFKAATALIYG